MNYPSMKTAHNGGSVDGGDMIPANRIKVVVGWGRYRGAK